MWAIFNGRYEAFHCLLNHGADPNFESYYDKRTPLYYASKYVGPDYEKDSRYCKDLLERGADPNKGDQLREAVCRSLEYTKLLVEYGADINTIKYGLSIANEAIIQRHEDIVEFLIIEKKAILSEPPFLSVG